MIEMRNFILPAHWMPALINGDWSGLDDDEAGAIRSFLAFYKLGTGEAADCEPVGFMHFHDAIAFYPFACDCERVTFHTKGGKQ